VSNESKLDRIIGQLDEVIDLLRVANEEKAKRKTKPKADQTPSIATFWELYSIAYEWRYKVPPTRNAMVNGLCASISKRVPAETYKELIGFFIRQNDAWYLREGHHLRCLVKDCETLLTRMKTGTVMTSGKAKQIEQQSDSADASRAFLTKKYGGSNEPRS